MPRFAPILVLTAGSAGAQSLFRWTEDFPRTDFASRSIDLSEVVTYGPKDSIPPIDNPRFAPVAGIGDFEPVLSIAFAFAAFVPDGTMYTQ